MSYIVKKQPLFEKSLGDAYAAFYLDVITDEIDYVSGMQNFTVDLIADTQGLNMCTLSGDGSVISICGREFVFGDDIPLFDGYNLVTRFELKGIETYAYNEILPTRLIFNHSCVELGLTGGIDVSVNMPVNKIYIWPELSLKRTSCTLGQNIELTGDFLSVGYDTFATVTVADRQVYSGRVGTDGIIPTSSEWMSGLPESTSASATVNIRSEFNGQALPRETSLELEIKLWKAGCTPDFAYEAYPISDNAAVQSFGRAVKTKSRYYICAKDITCMYGAQYKGCSITVDGERYDGLSHETSILTVAGNHTFSITVTDSRGISTTKSGSFEVVDYSPPRFAASVIRVNGEGREDLSGEGIEIAFQTENSYAFEEYNPFEHSFTVTKAENGEEVFFAPLVDDDVVIYDGILMGGIAYEVKVVCSDAFGETTEKSYTIECERIELNIAKNKIGIGKIAETEGLIDCAWPIRVEGDITFTDEFGNEISLRSLYKIISGQG